MPQPSHICVIANHMIATSEVITIATNYYNKFKLLFYDLLLFFLRMTGSFGDFGTARRTMVVLLPGVRLLMIVLPPGILLLTFAMILLVGSTEVHRI